MHLSNHNALLNPYLFETLVKIDFDVKYFIHSHLSFESLSFHSSSHRDVRGGFIVAVVLTISYKRSPVLKYIYQSEDIAYSKHVRYFYLHMSICRIYLLVVFFYIAKMVYVSRHTRISI